MSNPKKNRRKPNANDRLLTLNQQLARVKKIAVASTEQLETLAVFVNERTDYAVSFENGEMRIFAKPEADDAPAESE